jgi:hypothetical protein
MSSRSASMDSWIISRLEAAMSHSRISPYAVARFMAVVICPAIVLTFGHVNHWFSVWTIVVFFLRPIATYFNLIGIDDAERENARGYLNSLKETGRLERRLSLVFTFLLLAVFILIPDLDNFLWFGVNFLILAFHYFKCLNWTMPPKKAAPLSSDLAFST